MMLNKKVIIAIIVGIVLLVAGIILMFVFKPFNKNDDKNLTLEQRLEKIGIEYYTKFYYPEIPDKEKDLSPLAETGIKINLDNLSRYSNHSELIKTELTYFEECDYGKTRVVITPKAPYLEKDYSINVDLVCE